MRTMRGFMVLSLVLFATSVWADVGVLLGEPYGRGSGYNPTGHISIYLSRVCPDTPTTLRRCRDGEAGSVISRYNHRSEEHTSELQSHLNLVCRLLL